MTTWPVGYGDGTLAGQLAVACYALAAGACALNARPGRAGGAPGLWAGLALVLAALGVMEHLDAQAPLMGCGALLGPGDGWPPRSLVVAGLLGAVLAALAPAALRWRRLDAGMLIALAGVGATVGFAIVRAAYFEDLDRVLGLELASPCAYRAPELVALALATIGARISARHPRRNA